MALFADLLRSYSTPSGVRRASRETQWPSPSWISDSWQQPHEFFAALHREAEHALGGPAKSQLDIGIDFYSDLVGRYLHHPGRGLIEHSHAIRWFEPELGWQSLSLAQLDAQAGALAAILISSGTQAGDRLALVLPSGGHLLVGLLAALRIGCVAVPVLPFGSTYVQRLMEQSAADRVVTCSPYPSLRCFSDRKPLVLSPELLSKAGKHPLPATYAPDSPALLIASPLHPRETLRTVSAAQAYSCALRDGLLLFGLRPGDVLAAPNNAQYVPCTYLSALVCGAKVLDLSMEAVLADVSPLQEATRAVILSQAIRDALLDAGGGPVSWGCWFRDPQEGFGLQNWQRADEQLRLSSVLSANLLWDAASGGAILVSIPRRGPPQPLLWPAPGCPHLLAELAGEAPALTDVGRLVVQSADKTQSSSPGAALLFRTDDGYMYGGTVQPRRAGWSYPSQDVVDVLQRSPELAWLSGVAVVELSGAGGGGQALVVVVLFTGSEPISRVERAQCFALISRELGPSALPNQLEVFALHPRRLGGSPSSPIDSDWVRGQYIGSELFRKVRSPLFQALTHVRTALLRLNRLKGCDPP